MEANQTERVNQARIYRRKSVLQRLDGLSVSCLYRWMSEGKFPKPFKLAGGNAVGWDADEVDAWISAQMPKRADPGAA